MEMARDDKWSRELWIDAAYKRFEQSGLSSVKVEAIAKDLGATKGSFYWHFNNRKSLIDAVMERWERSETDQIIVVAESSDTPQERLSVLYKVVAARASQRRGEVTLYVDAKREGVQEIVARVSERRVGYIADILVELGFERDEAVRRGLVATAVVLGLQQLVVGAGQSRFKVSDEFTVTALQMTLAR